MMAFFIAGIFLSLAGAIFLFDGVWIFVSANYFKRRQDLFGAGEPQSGSERKKYYFVNRYSIASSQLVYGILMVLGAAIVLTASV
jgi:hypothetical protein